MGLKTYTGVADCHGIESMLEKHDNTAQDRMHQLIRAGANRQRHAVYYEVSIDDKVKSLIDEQLDQQNYPEALNLLKWMGQDLKTGADQIDSWRVIPDPELDPYGSGMNISQR